MGSSDSRGALIHQANVTPPRPTARAHPAPDRDLLAAINRMGGAIGHTPLVQLEHPHLDLRVKLEYANPFGSSKDRSCYWILRRAAERGELHRSSVVVESSSGNFAMSMASFARTLGLEFIPVIDPNCAAPTESYLRMACERVEKVDEVDASGGYLRARLDRVAEIRAELPAAFWPNQYGNVDAVEAHFLLTGGELSDALDRLTHLFVGVGTGGTIAGLSRRVKQDFPGVTVIAVDAEGSAIFGAPPRRRRIPGIGSSIQPELVHAARIDEVMLVPELAAVAGCHRLLREQGMYVGGSTGSVYAAIESYFADRDGPHATVAFLAADRGTAYAHTIFDEAWVAELAADDVRTPGSFDTRVLNDPLRAAAGRSPVPANG